VGDDHLSSPDIAIGVKRFFLSLLVKR